MASVLVYTYPGSTVYGYSVLVYTDPGNPQVISQYPSLITVLYPQETGGEEQLGEGHLGYADQLYLITTMDGERD